MTTVRIELTSAAGPAAGSVEWAPHRRRVESGAVVLTAPPRSVLLVDGVGTVDLEPTGPDWCWVAVERVQRGIKRYVIVPDSPDPVAYADLVDVDPATLEPVAEPEAAWWATIDGTVTAARVVGDDLIVTHHDGSESTAGDVRGPQGVQGERGEQGETGPKGDPGEVTQVDLSAHTAATTGVHGIDDTSKLETKAGAQGRADGAVSAHVGEPDPHPQYLFRVAEYRPGAIDLDELIEPNLYHTTATALNAPVPDQAFVQVLAGGAEFRVQIFTRLTSSRRGETWRRGRPSHGVAWNEWRKTDVTGHEDAANPHPQYPRLDITNTFTTQQRIERAGSLIRLRRTNAPEDVRDWVVSVTAPSGILQFAPTNDAGGDSGPDVAFFRDGRMRVGGTIRGDTGWRDITSLLREGLAPSTSFGIARMKRVDSRVFVELRLDVSEAGITQILAVPAVGPVGFRYTGPLVSTGLLRSATSPTASPTTVIGDYLSSSGWRTTGLNNPSMINWRFDYETTDAWPTTLPGTPYV